MNKMTGEKLKEKILFRSRFLLLFRFITSILWSLMRAIQKEQRSNMKELNEHDETIFISGQLNLVTNTNGFNLFIYSRPTAHTVECRFLSVQFVNSNLPVSCCVSLLFCFAMHTPRSMSECHRERKWQNNLKMFVAVCRRFNAEICSLN